MVGNFFNLSLKVTSEVEVIGGVDSNRGEFMRLGTWVLTSNMVGVPKHVREEELANLVHRGKTSKQPKHYV